MGESSKILKLHPDSQGPAGADEIHDSTLMVTLTVAQLREIIRQELHAVGNAHTSSENEPLLSVEQAASLLNVTPRWVYRHAKNLPFTRRLSRKALRFSEAGVRRWLAAKKSLT